MSDKDYLSEVSTDLRRYADQLNRLAQSLEAEDLSNNARSATIKAVTANHCKEAACALQLAIAHLNALDQP